MSIVDFLEARIAEDEARAERLLADLEASISRGHMTSDERGPVTPDRVLHGQLWAHYAGQTRDQNFAKGQIIADLASPTKALAEAKAKRAILAEHPDGNAAHTNPDGSHMRFLDGYCETCYVEHDPSPWPCRTLRHVAAVYADHPDYDQEWAL